MAVSKRRGEITRLCLAAGADPNIQRGDGATALHLAIENYPEIVDCLLGHGANANIQRQVGGARAIWLSL